MKTEEGLHYVEKEMEMVDDQGNPHAFVDCVGPAEEVLEVVSKELETYGLEIVLGVPDEPNDQTYFRVAPLLRTRVIEKMTLKLSKDELKAVRDFIAYLTHCRHCGHVFNWEQNVIDDSVVCPKCLEFNSYVE